MTHFAEPTTLPPPTRPASEGQTAQGLQDRLEDVFARLRSAGIPFCVLRNRDRIPSGLLNGSDVDLIVPDGTSPAFLIRLVADLKPTQIAVHRATVEMFFTVEDHFLHIDFLIADRQWRGARYLANATILNHTWRDAGIPVAAQIHQAFCAWFSSLTRMGHFKTRYIPLITEACRATPAEMQSLVQSAFGPQLSRNLLRLAAENRLAESDRFARRCRRSVWWRAFARRPVQTLVGLLRHYACEGRQLLRPSGLSVAVLGPDGAGKTAVCTRLAELSRGRLPFRRIEMVHLYRRFLPLLSELRRGRFRRRPAQPATVHDPHGKRPHFPLVSLLTLTYVLVDQWLSRWCWGCPRLAQNVVLLHDRHMLEILVDPQRFRYRGPRWLARLFVRLLPMPDVIVLLDAPAEVLQARKQEVPFNETVRQRQVYRETIERMSNGFIVDATEPPEQVAAQVRARLLAKLADRTAARFRLEGHR